MIMRPLFAILTVLLLLGAGAATAQEVDPLKKKFKPDPERGLVAAEKLCMSCHLIKADQTGAAEPGIPTFMFMADKPGQSEANLADNMMHPFPPMTDTNLTVHEIKDITAYILSLRKSEN